MPVFGVILVRIFSHICPYSVRLWENADQNNSEYRHFSRSVPFDAGWVVECVWLNIWNRWNDWHIRKRYLDLNKKYGLLSTQQNYFTVCKPVFEYFDKFVMKPEFSILRENQANLPETTEYLLKLFWCAFWSSHNSINKCDQTKVLRIVCVWVHIL